MQDILLLNIFHAETEEEEDKVLTRRAKHTFCMGNTPFPFNESIIFMHAQVHTHIHT